MKYFSNYCIRYWGYLSWARTPDLKAIQYLLWPMTYVSKRVIRHGDVACVKIRG